MSNRVSQIVLLCEDDEHRRLALAYMRRCGISTERVVVEEVASRKQRGGNDAWVLREFSRQLHACRQRQKRAKTLLVVLVDADTLTVDERRRQLNGRLKQAGYTDLNATDPVVLLIPRRHVETWIASLLGKTVTEDDDCKDWDKPAKNEIRQAAHTAYEWCRENATPGATCVPSFKAALPEWRKIG